MQNYINLSTFYNKNIKTFDTRDFIIPLSLDGIKNMIQYLFEYEKYCDFNVIRPSYFIHIYNSNIDFIGVFELNVLSDKYINDIEIESILNLKLDIFQCCEKWINQHDKLDTKLYICIDDKIRIFNKDHVT